MSGGRDERSRESGVPVLREDGVDGVEGGGEATLSSMIARLMLERLGLR